MQAPRRIPRSLSLGSFRRCSQHLKNTPFHLLIITFLPGFSHAATVTVGTIDTKDGYPLGNTPSGSAGYIGEYQQIYTSGAFPISALITQIAFSSYFSSSGSANYTLSIALGITTRTAASPGATFATGFTTVFSDSVAVHFTAADQDFDFPIVLTTPFNHDSTQGNLLLDVSVSSASGTNSVAGFIFDVDTGTSAMGRLWSSGGSPLPSSNSGLVTQFTVTPTPEPSSVALLLCGTALCLRRASFRERGPSVKSAHSPRSQADRGCRRSR